MLRTTACAPVAADVPQRRPAVEQPGMGSVWCSRRLRARNRSRTPSPIRQRHGWLLRIEGAEPATTAASWSRRVSSRSVAYSVPGDMAAFLGRAPVTGGGRVSSAGPAGYSGVAAPRRPPPRPPARRGAPRPVRRAASGWWRRARRPGAVRRYLAAAPRSARRAAAGMPPAAARSRGSLLSDRRPPSRHAPPDPGRPGFPGRCPASAPGTGSPSGWRTAVIRPSRRPSPTCMPLRISRSRYVRTSPLSFGCRGSVWRVRRCPRRVVGARC